MQWYIEEDQGSLNIEYFKEYQEQEEGLLQLRQQQNEN